MSTNSGVHIHGTENQYQDELWHKIRTLLLTATTVKEFITNQKPKIIKLMGLAKPFYSKYTQHGIDHEQDAIHDFEAKYGGNVVKCGAFISRKYPFLLASPDGLYGENLIEVKCPYILAETTPWDLKSLKKPQRQRHFCESTGNGRGIALKRSHKYFAQVQMAMLVTGFRNTVFIV